MKRILSVVAVLAIVGSALAFKVKNEGKSVRCFASTAVVTPTASCTASGQPVSTLVNFVVDLGGTITNPCTGTDVPYDAINGSACPNASSAKFRAPHL